MSLRGEQIALFTFCVLLVVIEGIAMASKATPGRSQSRPKPALSRNLDIAFQKMFLEES